MRPIEVDDAPMLRVALLGCLVASCSRPAPVSHAEPTAVAPRTEPASAAAAATPGAPGPCAGSARIRSIYELPEPRTLDGAFGQCARFDGWWGSGSITLAAQPGEHAGHVLRPFAFVRERNPSLGWPYWYALDVIFVDVGPKDEASVAAYRAYERDYREDLVFIIGDLNRLEEDQARARWDALTASRPKGAEPLGQTLLPALLRLTTGPTPLPN